MADSRMRLTMMIFQPEAKRVFFRDKMIESTALPYMVIDTAVKIMKPYQELVLAKWDHPTDGAKRIWLSQNNTIYKGAEANQLYQNMLSIQPDGHETMPDLRKKSFPQEIPFGSPTLTQAEHQVMDFLAQAWNTFVQRVEGDPEASDEDQREFMYHIHGAQNMILANAAGRIYPEKYRLRGGHVE